MVACFGMLNERDQRLYSAVEARKLAYGGVSYISRLLGITRHRIYAGMRDLDALENDCDSNDAAAPPKERIRRLGGGRKRAIDKNPSLKEAFLKIIEDHTAGDPMDKKKKWTDLSVNEISNLLKKAGYPEAGEHVVKGLLREHEFKKLKQRKVIITGSVDPIDRNFQFENIGHLRNTFIARSMPVIAVDTKKKEFLGRPTALPYTRSSRFAGPTRIPSPLHR